MSRAFLGLIALAITAGSSFAQGLSEVEVDQRKSVHSNSAVAEAEAKLSAKGGTFLINTLTIDQPLDLEGFANEYRANDGGPVSALFGIAPFQIQSGLVRAFTGFLLLIFTGIAVFTGLQRVNSGRGDLNFVPLAGKLLIGMIILWHPDYVYAVGRIIQTTGLYITKSAMQAPGMASLKDAIMASDMTKLSAAAVESQAIDQGAGNVAGYTLKRIYNSVDAFNRNYASAAGVGIPISSSDNAAAQKQAMNAALSRFKSAVANIEPYKSQFEAAREKHDKAVANVGADSPTVDFINKQYSLEVEKIATEAGTKLFGISEADKIWDGVIAKPGKWIDQAVEAVAGTIGSIIIPFAVWVLVKGAAMFLELTMIVLCVTFPLSMLEQTQQAFTGVVKAFFTCSIVPSVGYVLLSIFEAFAAFVFKAAVLGAVLSALPTGFGGTVASSIGYIIFWIVGVLIIIWKTPKITQQILTGGSVIASLASIGLASMASGLFTAAGVASALPALGATGAAGTGATGSAAIKGIEGSGKALDAGAKALDSETPTVSSAKSSGSGLPAGSDKAKLASPDQTRKAQQMETKMAQKQAKEASTKFTPEMQARAATTTNVAPTAAPEPALRSVAAKAPAWKYDGPPVLSTTAKILQVAVKAGAVGVLSGGSARAAFQILATQKAADLVAKNVAPASRQDSRG